MRIEMANLSRRNPCLGDRNLHGPARAVAILRTGRDVVRIRGRAVADKLGERFCTARQRVAQFLNDQDAGAFAHDEAVPRHVEGARGLGRPVIEASRKRACGSKATEADDVHACFRATAHGDVGLIGADKTSRIANRLDAGRARCHRCAERAFEAMADRDVTRRQVHQEGRYRKRRQAADTAQVDRAHRLGDGGKPADAGSDDRGCAQAIRFRARLPIRLRKRLFCRRQRKENEPVYLALILRRQDGIRIETSVRIFIQRGHHPTDLRRQVSHHIVRKPADARATGQETRPGRFDTRSEWRDRSKTSDNNPSHLSSCRFRHVVALRASAEDIVIGAVPAGHRPQTTASARSRRPLAGTASTAARR